MIKFSKYLPEFGWRPEILTVNKGYYRLQDDSFFTDIPDSSSVHRTPCFRLPIWLPWRIRNMLARWLLTVDEQVGWYPFALNTGKKLLKSKPIHVLYSSSSPYTGHLVAYSLKRSAYLPWIADFRDPWIGNFARHQPTRLHNRLDRSLESKVVHTADRVVVVSPPMRSELLSRYPDLPEDRVTVITNGFDPADFERIRAIDYAKDRFSIVYTGSFYSRELTPENFLAGMKIAIDGGQIPRSQVQVYFVGNIGRIAVEMVRSSNLADLIHVTGYLPHRESIAHLINADLLLLIIGSSPASRVVYTGKIFEYLAAKKPILTLAVSGAAADLIREADAGVVVEPDDPHQIADALASLYNRWRNGDLKIVPNPFILSRYDRRKLTGSLAKLLDEVSNAKR